MKGPPLGPGGEDITWPDQVAPRGRRTPSTRNVKPQTSNLQEKGGAGGGGLPQTKKPAILEVATLCVTTILGLGGWGRGCMFALFQ